MFQIQSSIYEFFMQHNAPHSCAIKDLAHYEGAQAQMRLYANAHAHTKADSQKDSQKKNSHTSLHSKTQQSAQYQALLHCWQQSTKTTQSIHDIYEIVRQCQRVSKDLDANKLPQILICSSEEILLAWHGLCACHTLQNKPDSLLPIMLPDIRLSPLDSTQSFYEEFHELFAKLTLWYENDCKPLLVSPPHTLMAFMPTQSLLHSFTLTTGQNINVQECIETLLHYGYEHVEIVEMQGEFSHRGDILDIFIPNLEFPVRISLFDTEIEEIISFNHETQKSMDSALQSIQIYPAMFSLNAKQHEYLQSRIADIDEGIERDVNALGFWFLHEIGGVNLLREYRHIFTPKALGEYLYNLEFIIPEALPEPTQTFMVLPNSTHFQDIESLKASQIQSTLKLNAQKKITIFSPTNALLKSHDIPQNAPNITSIIAPFYFNISAQDSLFIGLEKPKIARKRRVKLDIDALQVGAFVVHSEYGIGIFEAIKQVDIMGGVRDFISIRYANDDRLLLPVENLNMIEQYSADNAVIKLDKLGKSSFLRLKESIQEKLFAIANEIIRLQAQRELTQGVRLKLNTPEQINAMSAFESERGFTLTQDQERAIQESVKDLGSGVVMDRLLNGDVGFGKTEVAMTLCYVGALNNYNSIVLVPTTLLCNQHFESFRQRLHNKVLPNGQCLQVVKIDRFSTATQKKLIQHNQANTIQIIIGTHSIFNLELENIGLMVIDEEHKFGVKQKELLKQKSLTTHVLSMSATPIPRTLNMAYSKLKSISELKTPPFFKQESKTFVKIKQDSLIKEVILRELRRGGQVFYIFNNIAKIGTIKQYLLGLLPQLKILILHSKVNPKDTEKGMLDFLQKEYDVLLCTSIVESGIHLPNANTIIIDDAHNFGIADLHQLRGRVGRGKHIGFCYLLTNEQSTEQATKRLLSLEKNSYLGSGAALAYHDLEMRGGGNLLGEAQSGHIKQVGFGMYVRMLEDTLQQLLQSEQRDQKIDINLSVSAFLNEELVSSERMRLDLYRRLSQVRTEFEVREIEGEIEQRFGKLDIYSLQFLEIIIIKTLALQLKIKSISNAGYNISLIGHDDSRIILQSPTQDDDDILLTITTKLKELVKAMPPQR